MSSTTIVTNFNGFQFSWVAENVGIKCFWKVGNSSLSDRVLDVAFINLEKNGFSSFQAGLTFPGEGIQATTIEPLMNGSEPYNPNTRVTYIKSMIPLAAPAEIKQSVKVIVNDSPNLDTKLFQLSNLSKVVKFSLYTTAVLSGASIVLKLTDATEGKTMVHSGLGLSLLSFVGSFYFMKQASLEVAQIAVSIFEAARSGKEKSRTEVGYERAYDPNDFKFVWSSLLQ